MSKMKTRKREWWKIIITEVISLVMVIGIFGGRWMEVSAASTYDFDVSDTDFEDKIKKEVFAADDILKIKNEDAQGNKRYLQIDCTGPDGEGGFTVPIVMAGDTNGFHTFSFSEFEQRIINKQINNPKWQFDRKDIKTAAGGGDIMHLYFKLTDSSAEAPSGNSSAASGSSHTDSGASEPAHECNFQWVTTTEPQPGVDGLEEYKCVSCGVVKESRPIPANMASVKNLYGFIKDAPQNGTVTTDFGKLHTISDYLLKKMAERNDVTSTIQFEYNNTELQITFPAGTDYTPILTDTEDMYGFYGVAAKLGLMVTER